MLQKIMKPQVIGALFFLWFVLILAVQLYFLPTFTEITGLEVIELARGYSYEEANQMLAQYGEEGIAFYRQIQVVDMLVPLLSGLWISFLAIRLLFLAGVRFHKIGFIGLSIPLLDYAENAGVFMMLNTYPDTLSESLVAYVSTISTIKDGFYGVSFVVLLLSVVIWGVGKLKHKSKQST